MDHLELAKRIEKRLDKIEHKIDKHLEQVSTNKSDLVWVKGYIKTSISAIIAIAGTCLTLIFRVFYKS
jgi:predicted KAP-like P-loop ATPase